MWGTLSLGLFACGQFNSAGSSPSGIPSPDGGGVNGWSVPLTGLFYGGGAKVLEAQAIGVAVVAVAVFGTAMLMFTALNLVGRLRISTEGELEGLDIHEHGMSAYPEYVISALAAPHGMPKDTVGYLPEGSSGWRGIRVNEVM